MRLDPPYRDLADAYASAIAYDMPDIQYETRDWEEYRKTHKDVRITQTRRPTSYDIDVWGLFPQQWGSGSVGFGGMGTAAITPAYTIILEGKDRTLYVYFAGRFAYKIERKEGPGWSNFMEDYSKRFLVSVKDASTRYS